MHRLPVPICRILLVSERSFALASRPFLDYLLTVPYMAAVVGTLSYVIGYGRLGSSLQ
jgi:hypothetical protein